MKSFDEQGEVAYEFAIQSRLKFDADRAEENLSFKRADGSINLISPNEAKAKRIARESGRTLRAVLNDSTCGPLNLGFNRYDPETGDVFNEDGILLYNTKALQEESERLLEAQN